jgi:hypothetical protein
VVHGTNESSASPTLSAIAPVLAMLSASAALTLVIIGIVLLAAVLAPKIAPAPPRLTIMARLLRLVHSFIHSSTCTYLGFDLFSRISKG